MRNGWRVRRVEERDRRDVDKGPEALERHPDRNEQDDRKANPGDPAEAMEKARDKGRRDTHQHH